MQEFSIILGGHLTSPFTQRTLRLKFCNGFSERISVTHGLVTNFKPTVVYILKISVSQTFRPWYSTVGLQPVHVMYLTKALYTTKVLKRLQGR